MRTNPSSHRVFIDANDTYGTGYEELVWLAFELYSGAHGKQLINSDVAAD
jgi:hypothetical protein